LVIDDDRERSTGAYDTLSYFTAKYFVEAPLNLAPCVLFTSILYWMVGLNPDHFGYCILIMMYQVLTALSLGLWISCIAPSAEVANSLGLPAVIIALLFAGYYINIESLPIVANWIPYFSFIRWSYEALAINEFKGVKFTCGGGATGACLTTGTAVPFILFHN
jgi:ABC-type multidrug transport system permease subunit